MEVLKLRQANLQKIDQIILKNLTNLKHIQSFRKCKCFHLKSPGALDFLFVFNLSFENDKNSNTKQNLHTHGQIEIKKDP